MEWWMWVGYVVAGFLVACAYSWVYGVLDLGKPAYSWDTRREYPANHETFFVWLVWPVVLLVALIGVVVATLYVMTISIFILVFPENVFKAISNKAKESK